MAFALIGIQGLGHRLPAGGPEIPGFFIPQVDIPAGLVKLVEGIAQDPACGTALDKAVSAGVHSDDGTVIRRSEIVRPGGRGIGIGNHILSGFLIKIAVIHAFSSCVSRFFYLF